jgi:flavin-dependent dehydrogenase
MKTASLKEPSFTKAFAGPQAESPAAGPRLEDGARVAVVGGGPAGSFFSYFLLDLAERAGVRVKVDLYEPRDFSAAAPQGCNMCGGIVSESLVQALATEGIGLPPTVVQRGIDSYVLHTDVGSVRIDTPLREKRIAAVFRGPGPRDAGRVKWGSFDGFLQDQVREKGAEVKRGRVEEIDWESGRPRIRTRDGSLEAYDFVAVAVGVNTSALASFRNMVAGYRPPRTTRTFIGEYYLGEARVAAVLGSSMHVFLLSIPRLEFAAIIPKGDYATVCLLGREIDDELVRAFLESPVVRECLPPESYAGRSSCHCRPCINVGGAVRPFSDRIVFVGDCGFTRLYKDGIGAAYRTAKAAAATALFHGVSAADFERHYWPVCKAIGDDNRIGALTFAATRLVQRVRFIRRAVLRMVSLEQRRAGERRRMSLVLWDLFTGSASYRNIFLRALHPAFIARFLWNSTVSMLKQDRL